MYKACTFRSKLFTADLQPKEKNVLYANLLPGASMLPLQIRHRKCVHPSSRDNEVV
jgi:hypothetical protein